MVLLLRNPIYTQPIIINMRKITEDAIRAFYNKEDFKRGNTQVRYNLNMMTAVSTMVMYLHGHGIAKLEKNNLYIRHAGYTTNTTKERLNGLPNVNIRQKDFEWYLNGRKWHNGNEWTWVDCLSLEDFSFN